MLDNKYIEQLQHISLKNKYTKWYISIISKALLRQNNEFKNIYVEKHHILPKSFGIGGEKDKENIVILTAREHFIVHFCATKMFFENKKKNKMIYAFKCLRSNNKYQNRYMNSRLYESLKEKNFKKVHVRLYKIDKVKYLYSDDIITINKYKNEGWSDIMTEEYKVGRVGNMKGKKHSAVSKNKISNSNKGRKNIMTDEIKRKISNSNKGRTDSKSTRKKKSMIAKQMYECGKKNNSGKHNPMYGRKRKAMYNPNTMECKYIDITDNFNELNYLLSFGWKYGLIRKPRK